MQSAKEKVSNMASAAKHKIEVAKAKTEEKADKARARTKEERKIADEREKVREAEAKADLHAAKARHAAQKLEAKRHHHVPCLGMCCTGTGTATGDHLPGTGHRYDEYGTYTTTNEPVIGGAPTATNMPGTTTNTGYPLGTHPRRQNYL